MYSLVLQTADLSSCAESLVQRGFAISHRGPAALELDCDFNVRFRIEAA